MNHDIPANVLTLPVTDEDLRTVPRPFIVNVVATFATGCSSIDAELLTMRLPGFCFNPQKFAAIKMRMNRAMALAFCGGHAVCPGSRRVNDARLGALHFVRMLLEAGQPVYFQRFRVQNIVCSCWAPFGIDVKGIQDEYSGHANFTMSKFPGLAFRMLEPAIVFNIFTSGKVVITGSRDYEHSVRAWHWLYTHVLTRHRAGAASRGNSSAMYKVETERSRDTFSSDCDRLATKHARRPDGPLMRSQYGDQLLLQMQQRTPMSASSSRFSTPALASPAMSFSSPSTSGAMLLMDRASSLFAGHTISCPYVRGTAADGGGGGGMAALIAADDEQAKLFWRESLRAAECALGDDAHGKHDILAEHQAAGCLSMGVLNSAGHSEQVLRDYAVQLHVAVHGGLAAMAGGCGAPQDVPGWTGETTTKRPASGLASAAFLSPATAAFLPQASVTLDDVFDAEAQRELDTLLAWTEQFCDADTAALPFAPAPDSPSLT